LQTSGSPWTYVIIQAKTEDFLRFLGSADAFLPVKARLYKIYKTI